MIAIDTNVLLRYLLQDDEEQSKKANKILAGAEKVLITDVVLVETVWTLKGKRYSQSREQLIEVLHALFKEPNLQFEDSQVVWRALKDFTEAKPLRIKGKVKQADFPDALIVNKAIRFGELKKDQIKKVYTFDKAALEIKGAAKA